MLRAGCGVLSRLAVQDVKCGQSSFALEFVRWRRKPRWLPVAKSKLFRIPERIAQTPEEKAELQRLHNNYKTQMRSLRQYFREEVVRLQETSTKDHIVLTAEQEEEQFQESVALNEAWNSEIAAERESRLQRERSERAKYIQERLQLAQEREEERLERVDAIVRKEKELSKMYITREKLDEAIERALANPVDHNFAIDLQGNIYRGRNAAKPSEEEPQQLKASL